MPSLAASEISGSNDAEATAWAQLRADPCDHNAREWLVDYYLPMVKTEAQRLCSLLPSHVDRHELMAEGALGLLSAIAHFDPSQGPHFASYARKRIWGRMMDRVRSMDFVPRSVRKAAKRINAAIAQFLHKHARQPGESELAEVMGCSIEELHSLERQAALGQQLSLDVGVREEGNEAAGVLAEQIPQRREPGPLDRLIRQETSAELVEALQSLPDRERAILVLYYAEGVRLKEIAEAMDVSESRASQLHNQALLRLNGYLQHARDCRSSAEGARKGGG